MTDATTQFSDWPGAQEPGHRRRRRCRRRGYGKASERVREAALGRHHQDGSRRRYARDSAELRAHAARGRPRPRARHAARPAQSVADAATAAMAALAIRDTDAARVLALSGRLDANSIRDVWREARSALAAATGKRVVVDASGVDYCDGAGIALFVDLLRQRQKREVEVTNLKPAFATLLAAVRRGGPRATTSIRRRSAGSSIEEIGATAGRRLAGHPRPDRVRRRDSRRARLRRPASELRRAGATSGCSANASAPMRCRSSRFIRVPARRDPRVPVGDPDEEIRRRDLRRRPDRAWRCCASSAP